METDPSLVSLLQDLVAIPSVSPKNTDDAGITGEARMADYLEGHLSRSGFSVTRQEIKPGRPNLIAVYGPQKPRRVLLLEGHLDTVGIAGMRKPPFRPQIEGGRLYGRGACDDKGPMAAALHALSGPVLESMAKAGIQVWFVGAMGEEEGNRGAENLAESGRIQADLTLVLEPTELNIIHAHKGVLWYEIEVGGKAAHGSHPELGVNAIVGMAQVLQLLQAQISGHREEQHDPILGQPTLNIGVIHGGTGSNVVPDKCTVHVDRRVLPGENPESILQPVRARLAELQGKGLITRYDLRITKNGIPFSTAANGPLVAMLKAACRQAGYDPALQGAAWYSDAGPLSGISKEIVVFGPGSIKQAHTENEHIELSDLQRGCDILKHFFRQLVQNG